MYFTIKKREIKLSTLGHRQSPAKTSSSIWFFLCHGGSDDSPIIYRANSYLSRSGIFADSGDNRQYTLSLTYVKVMGVDGRFTFMPEWLTPLRNIWKVPVKTGTISFSIGASLMYQWTDWLSAQTFLTNASMSSNSIPDFSATDFGLSLSASHRF